MYRVYKKLIGLNFISIRQCPSHGKFWPVLKNSGPQVTLLKRSWGESQIYPNTISSEELPNTSTKGTKDVKHLIAISNSNMLNLIRKNSIIVIKSWVKYTKLNLAPNEKQFVPICAWYGVHILCWVHQQREPQIWKAQLWWG